MASQHRPFAVDALEEHPDPGLVEANHVLAVDVQLGRVRLARLADQSPRLVRFQGHGDLGERHVPLAQFSGQSVGLEDGQEEDDGCVPDLRTERIGVRA